MLGHENTKETLSTMVRVMGISIVGIGLLLTGAGIGMAFHGVAQTPVTMVPTQISSPTILVVVGTTAMVFGFGLLFARRIVTMQDKHTLTMYDDRSTSAHISADAMRIGRSASLIIAISSVLGLGYGVGHLAVGAALSAHYKGLELLGIEGVSAFGLSIILPILITIFTGVRADDEKLQKVVAGASISLVAGVAGAASALAGPALSMLLGSGGAEAIVIEWMLSLSLALTTFFFASGVVTKGEDIL